MEGAWRLREYYVLFGHLLICSRYCGDIEVGLSRVVYMWLYGPKSQTLNKAQDDT